MGRSPVLERRRLGWDKFLILLLALSFVHGLLYAAIVPPWQSPDEPYHLLSGLLPSLAGDPTPDLTWNRTKFETMVSLVEFRFWDLIIFVPAVREQEEIHKYLPNGFQFTNASTPRSYIHYLLSFLLGPVRHQEMVFRLYWARTLSVVTNLAIVAVAYATARLLFGDDWFGRALLPLSIIFLPQHTFILSSVSDGNPAELFISIAIYFLVLGVVKGLHWHTTAMAALFTALGVAAKPTTFFFVPILLLLLGVQVWRGLPGWWRLSVLPVIIGLIYTLTFVSFRFKSVLGASPGRLFSQKADAFLAELASEPVQRGIMTTFRGYWAFLGWSSLAIDATWGWLFLILTILACAGLLKLAWRCLRGTGCDHHGSILLRVSLLFVLCVIIDSILVAVWFIWSDYRQGLYDARYLFGVVIPIMTLLVIGWRELIPAGWRKEGMVFLAAFFFLFDAVVLLGYAVPFFYPLWS